MNSFLFQQINPVKFLDRGLFNGVNDLALKSFWLDTFAIYFAEYLVYLLIFCLLVFLVFRFKRYWRMVVEALVSAAFTRMIVVRIIRWILPRARPFVGNQVNLLLEHIPSSAFPSGHTSFSFAIATIVYFYNKKAGIFFFVASFLIGISRVFCGVHWPLDILAGIVAGIFSGWLIHKIFQRYLSHLK